MYAIADTRRPRCQFARIFSSGALRRFRASQAQVPNPSSSSSSFFLSSSSSREEVLSSFISYCLITSPPQTCIKNGTSISSTFSRFISSSRRCASPSGPSTSAKRGKRYPHARGRERNDRSSSLRIHLGCTASFVDARSLQA